MEPQEYNPMFDSVESTPFGENGGMDFGDDNLGFDLPAAEETTSTYLVTPTGTEYTGEQEDAEDVWNQETDHEAEDKAYKATLPPGGWYVVQGLTATRKNAEPLRRFPHILTTPQYSMFGYGVREVDGKPVKAKISFNISPILNRKVDYETGQQTDTIAMNYKLYVSAKKAYKAATGQESKTPMAVIQYLTQYPIQVRTFQADDGLIVLEVKEFRG